MRSSRAKAYGPGVKEVLELTKTLQEQNPDADYDGFIRDYLGLSKIIDRFTKDPHRTTVFPPLKECNDYKIQEFCSAYVMLRGEYTDEENENIGRISDKYGLPDYIVRRFIGAGLIERLIKIRDTA